MHSTEEAALVAAREHSMDADHIEIHPIKNGLWAVEAFQDASDGTPLFHVERYFLQLQFVDPAEVGDSVAGSEG